jgi:hypothetical protein
MVKVMYTVHLENENSYPLEVSDNLKMAKEMARDYEKIYQGRRIIIVKKTKTT